jgi:hypothetical protein
VKLEATHDEHAPRSSASLSSAGDLLLHPIAIASLGLLIINDHVFKAAWPGVVTGKLSDIGGMIFFPLFVVSAWEIVLALSRRWRGPSSRAMAIAAITSIAMFTLVKTWPVAAAEAGRAWGLAQWLLGWPYRLLAGQSAVSQTPTSIVVDPTDLVALPAVALAIWIGFARVAGTRSLLGRRRVQHG